MTVIEAAGLVAMPGIIDTHSHIAIQGGVNEFSLSIVPEVRVKDVVTGDDVSIFRALAGGTTTARLLHGSANTIGGQDAVVKLRYGKPGRDLIIRDAPQGVKFALGENVTRSQGRFPNSRMGVESVIERAFEEGKAYLAEWKSYEQSPSQEPGQGWPAPRRDLRLEALGKIVEGSIKIHSHCYRSDEILMLLRTAERFGIRVQSLQHVLEGYKVAAEISEHGASASTFSDWWAYKVEAYDAIPFNAALLTKAGANVCIKSDSEELNRHLNLEAAKMVKYGGVSEAEALAMITLNPARELGLDRRLGSIETGKDADIVLFNAHPFDAFSRCELAIIDGEVCFQRHEPDGKLHAPARRPHRNASGQRSRTQSRDRFHGPAQGRFRPGRRDPASDLWPGHPQRHADRRRRQDCRGRTCRHASSAPKPRRSSWLDSTSGPAWLTAARRSDSPRSVASRDPGLCRRQPRSSRNCGPARRSGPTRSTFRSPGPTAF